MKKIKRRVLTWFMIMLMVGTTVKVPISHAESSKKLAEGDSTDTTSVMESDEIVKGFDNNKTTLNMQLYARYNSKVADPDGGSLEIVEYNEKNGYAYSVSGVKGMIIASEVKNVKKRDKVAEISGIEYDVKPLVEEKGAAYGDITSVAISPDGTQLAAAIQHKEYDQKGYVAVFTCNEDGTLADPVLYDAGVQPDMVTFANDTTILSADEGEPRNGYTEGTVDPKGSVSIINLSEKTSKQVDFSSFSTEELTAKNIILGVANGNVIAPEADLEPEYITVTKDGKTAYVSLQEANAIAVLDIASMSFTGIYSCGFEDYSKTSVDIVEDGKYEAKNYENLIGARMPDGISLYEKDGKNYLITANEGDSREWGDYSNESKTKKLTGSNVKVLDPESCQGLPSGKTTLFGGRSFTMFEVTADGMKEVYDSDNGFEEKTASFLPEYFNCSNDDVKADSRSTKKGPEAENVTVGTVNGRTYAFVALERIGGIMVYDITDPEYVVYSNYINSREFTSELAGDVSPEGLCFIQSNGEEKAVLLAACEVSGTLAAYELTPYDRNEIVILYTNDVHNAYVRDKNGAMGYAAVAAYKKTLEAQGLDVTLVDNGDAIQGGVIGALSKGQYIIDIMEKTGYDLACPGNHEFDFGMDNFLNIAKSTSFDYVSCNFMDKQKGDGQSVLDPYKIFDINGKKVAIVGITTPETFTKSTPTFFQDDKGNYIYSFCEGNQGTDLYQQVQKSINDAKAEGADYIIALGHLGTDPSSEPWRSEDVIANTTGIDAFLDGHSHSTIESQKCMDKSGKKVLLSSTGTKLTSLGQLVIDTDGTMKSSLIKDIKKDDTATLNYVNEITDKFDALQKKVVAKTEVNLVVNDPVTSDRLVRSQETNLGDLCADAYRTLLGADIAFVNGGGVRANVKAGDLTYGDIISVHPFGNAACLVEAKGQEILDALELGARAAGKGESGGFLQVSGLSYDINTTIPSSVQLNDKSEFVGVNGPYRVNHVMVGGEPLDLNKTYKLASHNYMLKSGGDGFVMFKDNKLLKDEVKLDNQVLIDYIVDSLGGVVKADSIYADPYGEGRIKVITEMKDATCTEDGYQMVARGASSVKETTQKATGHQYGKITITWNGYEALASHMCEKCKEVEAVPCTVTSAVTKQPSTTEKGIRTYTAIAEYKGEKVTETKTEELPMVPATSAPVIPATSTPTPVNPVQSPTASTQPSPSTSKPVKKTSKNIRSFVIGNAQYKVLKKNKTVAFVKLTKDRKNAYTIPKTVTYKGTKYKITEISKNAFKNRKKLTKLTISENVTKIGANAFKGMSKLKTIKIKSTKITRIEKKCFSSLNSKVVITVPKKKLATYKKLFKKSGISKKIMITK
ncbi:5'-nucleotidase [Lachnospiraceae bacterium KM106-2]|nr:5'-nucleotidase [Lachnospiraceae bacterium KM106-2]